MSKKKTYYATEAQCEEYNFNCVEDINDLFEEFDDPKIKSIIAVEFVQPKKWGNTFCGIDIDTENPECGKDCQDYNPLNGVSGRCRHLIPELVKSGKKFKLTIDDAGIQNVSELMEVVK